MAQETEPQELSERAFSSAPPAASSPPPLASSAPAPSLPLPGSSLLDQLLRDGPRRADAHRPARLRKGARRNRRAASLASGRCLLLWATEPRAHPESNLPRTGAALPRRAILSAHQNLLGAVEPFLSAQRCAIGRPDRNERIRRARGTAPALAAPAPWASRRTARPVRRRTPLRSWRRKHR